jgi:hydrogenase expression/formation protein HypC
MNLCVGVLVSVKDAAGGREGIVSVGGARSAVALDLVPSAQPGDALLVHAGVALGRVTEEKEGEPPCA